MNTPSFGLSEPSIRETAVPPPAEREIPTELDAIIVEAERLESAIERLAARVFPVSSPMPPITKDGIKLDRQIVTELGDQLAKTSTRFALATASLVATTDAIEL